MMGHWNKINRMPWFTYVGIQCQYKKTTLKWEMLLFSRKNMSSSWTWWQKYIQRSWENKQPKAVKGSGAKKKLLLEHIAIMFFGNRSVT